MAGHDPMRALVIDPVLSYSTYLGGSGIDKGASIAVDGAGNAYVTGETASIDFPTVNPLQATNKTASNYTAFVAKLNPAGSALVYSTYLGGSTGDRGLAIAADAAGNAYVTGDTMSTDFPTVNPLQATNNSDKSGAYSPSYGDAGTTGFVPKLSPVPAAAGPSSSSMSFGGVLVNATSPKQSVTLTDSGDALLTLTSITASGDFALVTTGSSCPYSGGTLAPATNCTIHVTFTPTATGSLTGTVTITDNGSGSPQAVQLAGIGIVSAPTVSPVSLTFSNQLVSTTSASQPVTVTNTSPVALNITSLAISSDWTQSNNCVPSVAPSASCTINVSFQPTAVGLRTGTLALTDYALNSPQTIALSGTGQDFSFATPSGSSTSAAVAPGQSATYTLTMAGEGGFNQSVSLTCTGAPSEATCTVPNPVTAGSSPTNVTVSITTTASSVSAPRSRPLPRVPPLSQGLRGLLMLALVLTAMEWAIGRRNRPGVSRWRSAMVALASALLLALALAGCGGGGASTSTTSNAGTPAGTYNLTVTGSTGSGSSTLSHSVTLTLTVS